MRDAAGIEHVKTLAVLQCTSGDVQLRTYFLRSMSGLLKTLPEAPSESQVDLAVRKLVELFRAMEAAPRRSLQGLWCELLLIDRALDVPSAAMAWHAGPHDLFDFVSGPQAVEVKSCIGPLRRHHFLLNQVLPPTGSTTIVASFVLDESGSGTSLAQLWDSLAGRPGLSDDLKERCSQILAESLGQDWRKATRVAFDRNLAERNMRLFDTNTIPKVDPRVPVEVAHVEFTSELTTTPVLQAGDVAGLEGLFRALFGRR